MCKFTQFKPSSLMHGYSFSSTYTRKSHPLGSNSKSQDQTHTLAKDTPLSLWVRSDALKPLGDILRFSKESFLNCFTITNECVDCNFMNALDLSSCHSSDRWEHSSTFFFFKDILAVNSRNFHIIFILISRLIHHRLENSLFSLCLST